jgi:ABC-type Fe3+ transport system permease subunit
MCDCQNSDKKEMGMLAWVVACICWLFPLLGFPVIGWYMTKAWKTRNSGFMIALVFSLVLCVANATLGAYLGYHGKL